MMKKIFCFFFLVSTPLIGATWNWESISERAKTENMALKTAREQLISTEYSQKAALKGFLPTLRGNISAMRTGSERPSAIVTNGQIVNSTSSVLNDTVVTSLNFSQNLFSGLKDWSRYSQAKWQTQNKYWSLVKTKSEVSYSLKEAFSSLLYAQEYAELTKEIISRRESNYQIVKVRFESGRENKGSVLLAQAYLDQARLDAIIAADNLSVARKQLFSLINKDAFEEYRVEGEPPLLTMNLTDEDLKEVALNTPDYHQAFSMEKSSEEEVRALRSAFIPSLDFSASISRNSQFFFPDENNQRWTLGLNLSIPIFDGLSDYSTLKGAVSNKYAAEATKRNTYLTLIPSIRQAVNLARQSDVKLRVDARFREASQTRAEIARAKYNNGLLTFEDWDIIESELINRQINYLQSKRDRIVKYAAFEKSIGKGSIE